LLEKSGKPTSQTQSVLATADGIFDMKGPVVDFHKGSRTTAMFFDGNTSFKWTYMSTPALYRPGPRTGSYHVSFEILPVKPREPNLTAVGGDLATFEGRLHGISLSDMAVAVAEEAEGQTKGWKHWCPFVPDLDEEGGPVYAKIEDSVK
ncbi:hypothetical protein BDP55DRAFT_569253, partial [Colletotrichum godetiae]